MGKLTTRFYSRGGDGVSLDIIRATYPEPISVMLPRGEAAEVVRRIDVYPRVVEACRTALHSLDRWVEDPLERQHLDRDVRAVLAEAEPAGGDEAVKGDDDER